VDPSFDPAVQVFCSRGFAVAAPNYRGSTGFGRTYRTALDGLWGIADVDDVIAYTRGLVADGLVDDRALFIRGGSAGGFTALRALESGLFLGATGNYACTDLLRLASVTHDFELHYLDTLLGPLATHEDTYIDRSPINHPERLKGSVLLLQGADDVVVPAAQTNNFVEACAKRGIEVRARIFPNEGHGFRGADTLIAAWAAELEHYDRLLHRNAPSR
jgi:dipeptidyl aminopeptidase/acylaminoacyl peptidase